MKREEFPGRPVALKVRYGTTLHDANWPIEAKQISFPFLNLVPIFKSECGSTGDDRGDIVHMNNFPSGRNEVLILSYQM